MNAGSPECVRLLAVLTPWRELGTDFPRKWEPDAPPRGRGQQTGRIWVGAVPAGLWALGASASDN
jgi:hypothetical protein